MTYNQFWNLSEKPFENTPDPKFLYWSRQHEEAMSRMLYVIKEKKGAMLITGEYGSGKTLLTRVLLKELSSEQYQEALILNPMLSPTQMIKEIIHQLGGVIPAATSKAMIFNKLNELLLDINKKNKLPVIVVDEAQAIEKIASFEEFRLMLNFQLNDGFLLSLVLVGQPELKTKIKRLPQLEQRLALRYHLRAFSELETKEYILHRLKVAGSVAEIFSEDAFKDIFAYSEGIARKINNICDFSLLVGSGEKAGKIDSGLMKKVVADLKGEEFEKVGAEK